MQRQGDVVPEIQPIEISKPTLIGKKIQFKRKPQNQSRSPRSTLCRSSRQELTSMYNRNQQQQRPIGPINQMNRNQQRPINQSDHNQQQSPINLMNRNRIYPAPTPPQSPRQLVNRKQMAKKNGDQPNWHR
ncbi:hypothetical protein KR044_003865 [Drosophila immigrans]|nr:hypothetical protein KR044_003865 [Drosophila immigrans]